MKPLTLARQATERAIQTAEKRDQAIRSAHSAGETIRAIAAATGLSSARIHQIIHGR